MQEKNDSLIAYNILNEKIISKGFCTLCGACEASCPTGAIVVDEEKNRRVHDCSTVLDVCPICYETCPHTETLQLRVQKSVSDAPVKREGLGYYCKVLLAQAADPKLRELSHGGGVVTALLTYGMKDKQFDSAVISRTETGTPTKTKTNVATTPDDIMSAVGSSKFSPSPIAKTFGAAVYGYGKKKIAFVGVPCHILALRKIEAWEHKIGENLAATIGLFCFGAFSMAPLLKYLEDTYHVKASEIKRMRLSRQFVVETNTQTIRIPIQEVENHILPSCRTCTDFTAELSDISVGSAYPLEDWSTVIIRTKVGEDLFNAAVKSGIINTRAIEKEPKVFEHVLRAAIQKQTSAIQQAKQMKDTIGYMPILMLHESPALANVTVEKIMTKNVKTVSADITVAELLDLMARQHHIAYPVVNEQGEPIGIVTLEQASMVESSKRSETKVNDILIKNVPTVVPGETALDAYRKMNALECGRVLVLSSEEPKKLLGIVTKSDLMQTLIDQP